MKKGAQIFIGLLFTINLLGQQLPYQNPNLNPEERAKDLITRLTLDEKAILMCDVSEAIPRLGIKEFNWWSEALHGLANNDSVTVFPQPIGMAASFDDTLVYQIFRAVSDETRARYNIAMKRGLENRRFLSLSVWTPNINIFRDPRWGRGQETYGEDPYLTSRMGISVVKGLQGPSEAKYRELLACAKHYAVHSGPEWSRHTLNINNLDPRDLWETYLPAFKALVQQADVREVMCAYQRLDDEPCCGNTRLLQNILRDDWGFKYLVVSDCGAVTDFFTTHKVSSDAIHASARSVLAGTDVECVWLGYSFNKLPDAVSRGLISEEEINKHLMRVIEGRISLGEMDSDSLVPWTRIPASVINSGEHQKLALRMAQETMTLLQNKNNILPLSKSGKKVAIIGPNADDKPLMWGSYNGTPVNTITILDGIKSKIPADKIVYDKACDIVEDKVIESEIANCSIDDKAGIKATYWNNQDYEGDIVATEQIKNPLRLTAADKKVFSPGVHRDKFSAKYETVYKPTQPGEIAFKFKVCGGFCLIVNGDTLSSFDSWRPLPMKAYVKVEAGKEYRIEVYFRQENNWTASLNLNFGKEFPVQFETLIEKLKSVDLVIFAGGISPRLEGEEMPVFLPGFRGGDRTDIELPTVQRNCLKALKQAGKKIIFINCSGSAIGLVPETQNCDAILQAWYGGESGGQAVADVLFGDYNPSGKLPITFYKNLQQLPDFEDYSMKGRTYRYMSDPLFPFGYGLSYTSFLIGNAKLSKTSIKSDESAELTIPVSNTGKRDGSEVVQVYIHKVNDADGPFKTLKGFQKIYVAAGKTSLAIINLPYKSFEFYDKRSGKMTVASGEYEVYYGTSSDTKDLKMNKIMIQ